MVCAVAAVMEARKLASHTLFTRRNAMHTKPRSRSTDRPIEAKIASGSSSGFTENLSGRRGGRDS
eukprot:1190878-Prorocentrum_minimum.AAC.1